MKVKTIQLPKRSRWLESVPNALTGFRICSVPVLWGLALLELPFWVGVGWAVAAATDALDGPIARRNQTATAMGSRLDSIADHLLSASAVAWLWMLRPEFFREQKVLLAVWALTALTALGLSLARFGRPVDLHRYSAKAAAVLGSLFGISLMIFGTYSRLAFYVVWAVCMLAAVEALVAARDAGGSASRTSDAQ